MNKGDRILVVGKLRVRELETDERTGSNIEVEAEAIGHDLTWGTGVFTRSVGAAIPAESEEAAEPIAVGGTQGEHQGSPAPRSGYHPASRRQAHPSKGKTS